MYKVRVGGNKKTATDHATAVCAREEKTTRDAKEGSEPTNVYAVHRSSFAVVRLLETMYR